MRTRLRPLLGSRSDAAAAFWAWQRARRGKRHLHCAPGCQATLLLARMLDSLIRVSRRVSRSRRNPGAAPRSAGTRPAEAERAVRHGDGPGAGNVLPLLAAQGLQVFDPLSKVLFKVLSRYFFAIGLVAVLSLGRGIPAEIRLHSQTTQLLGSSSRCEARRRTNTTFTHWALRSRRLHPPPPRGRPSRRPQLHGPPGPGFECELFALHSPLLGESQLFSLPALSDMLEFSA